MVQASEDTKTLILEWDASPTNDMIADALAALVLHMELNPLHKVNHHSSAASSPTAI